MYQFIVHIIGSVERDVIVYADSIGEAFEKIQLKEYETIVSIQRMD